MADSLLNALTASLFVYPKYWRTNKYPPITSEMRQAPCAVFSIIMVFIVGVGLVWFGSSGEFFTIGGFDKLASMGTCEH